MKRPLLYAAGALGVLLLILWQAGAFRTGTIAPGTESSVASGPEPQATTTARRAEFTTLYEAVGTIRPRTETSIEAQVTGKIREIRVKAGEFVKRGEVLVVLDARALTSRVEQAEQGLSSARAGLKQAQQAVNEAQAAFDTAAAQYRRIKTLYAEKAVAEQEMDQAEAAYLQAEARLKQTREGMDGARAQVRQAEKMVEEASIAKGYTEIVAPEDMEVAKRMAEPGDLAVPGKPLLIVQTAGSMRLEAHVREGLIARVRPGGELDVAIPALERTVTGVVEEVVPSADTATRTFLVKVGLPEIMGAYPGMFGRLLVPSGMREAVLVDARAVTRTGQLETLRMNDGGAWRTVYVKTAPAPDGDVEILSGLSGGETVALPGGAQ